MWKEIEIVSAEPNYPAIIRTVLFCDKCDIRIPPERIEMCDDCTDFPYYCPACGYDHEGHFQDDPSMWGVKEA